MADTGKPLPFPLRVEIKEHRQRETVRQVAERLGLSKTTVQKYGNKRGTNLLKEGARSE